MLTALFAAFVLGVIVGYYAPRLVRRLTSSPKVEDRNAGLRRYQAMKNG